MEVKMVMILFWVPAILAVYLGAVVYKRVESSARFGFNGGRWQKKVTEGNIPEAVPTLPEDAVINLDHGDPKLFEPFWRRVGGGESKTTIPSWQSMSYFSDLNNFCWFLEPALEKQIRRIHKIVGNANTQGRYIVVGTGSTQLYQAALWALSPPGHNKPVNVVSGIPFYSSYALVTDYVQSELYRWCGDAYEFNRSASKEERENCIELITSPNNPDGFKKETVVDGCERKIYDMAYYWPQYAPITGPADHELMTFTFSKSTGHAGTRIGWAIVKDEDIARKMSKFVELNTIGVSKDSQIRASQILASVSDSYESMSQDENFFHYSHSLMSRRWSALREAVQTKGRFKLPDFPTEVCSFFGNKSTNNPAFAWVECDETIGDCSAYLKENGILTRSGIHFGSSPKHARISMLDRDNAFELFVKRMSVL